MSKKNSNVILKNNFKNYEELTFIYSSFKKKINYLKKKTFLIAVSGGPDSLALTALAKSYSYKNKCKIYYVLVDHNLRKNSSKEAHLVKRLLKKHHINLKILKNKKIIKKNIQSEARLIRYNLLMSFCEKNKISTILTAHNLEDQVETFFIRLSRGSGLNGLSSMKQINKIKNKISLVRPLLDLKKDQLIKISKLIFGKFYKDPSNQDTKYLRTRVRNLKESLEKSGINYDQIFKSITNLASSRDTLNLYFEKIYKELVEKKKNKIVINLKNMNKLNLEMKLKVFEKLIKDFTNSYYAPRSKKIFNLINQIQAKRNAKLTLGGCVIMRENNHIIIKKEIKK
jgi:tRNA(Ile)-lysidine synthase